MVKAAMPALISGVSACPAQAVTSAHNGECGARVRGLAIGVTIVVA
jgi:hypothetical protein